MTKFIWKRRPLVIFSFALLTTIILITRRYFHVVNKVEAESAAVGVDTHRKVKPKSEYFTIDSSDIQLSATQQQQQHYQQQYIHPPSVKSPIRQERKEQQEQQLGKLYNGLQRPCGPHLDHNEHFVNREHWHSLTTQQVLSKKMEWKSFLSSKVPLFNYDRFQYSGRGIVYTASGGTLQRAMASIRILRSIGNQLPVQIWHIKGELSDEDLERIATELPGSVSVKDIVEEQQKWEEFRDFHVGHDYGSSRNYHIKTLVLLLSEFREVLYLDSDNMPLQDPTVLFSSAEYAEYGTIFWPDFWKFPVDNPMWSIMERPCEDEWEQESGQIVLDKKRAWRALLLSLFLQKDHDFYFRIILGDKDTYRFSWKTTNTPYYMIPHPVAIGGRIRQGRFCGHTMLQHSPDGSLLFAHTTSMKTTNALHQGSTWEAIQYYEPAEARPTRSTVLGMIAYEAGYPKVIEFHGAQAKSKEDGGKGQELMTNPCLELSIVNASVHTFPAVVDRLNGVGRAVDSYRVVTESLTTYGRGNLTWLEQKYYEYGGPGSGTAEYCGGGVRGNGNCRMIDECCSAWGYCGSGVDYCGVSCFGGNCYRSRILPAERPSDFQYCGGGNIGYGLCADGSCCSKFGWCGKEKDFCMRSSCISGPCLKE